VDRQKYLLVGDPGVFGGSDLGGYLSIVS
jgi:hypothetical protein